MRWTKRGRVYVATGEQPWKASHAWLPTPFALDDERVRIYFACVDRDKFSRVGFVDLDARDPLRVLRVSATPSLDLGEPGTFDEHGVTPVCAIPHDGRVYLTYAGWQRGIGVRYYLFTGLAISDDGGETFRRGSQVPILDRSDGELFVRSAAWILRDDGRWKMWYAGGDRWVFSHDRQMPSYVLRYLESSDLANWSAHGDVCLEWGSDDEFGFGRPFVIRDGDLFRMWYSIRTFSKGYRVGYAESRDGRHWTRKDDEVGLDVSDSGWDSQMVCYSSVVRTRYGTYLFYNGNNYGETGFGVAALDE